MSFPRYPEYKDSGVEWLGEVPGHWNICALKRIADLKSGESITAEDIEEDGEFPVFGGNGLRGFTTHYTHEGAYAMIGRQGALCGNINYATGKFWASEHAVVATPKVAVETHWLGELMRAMNLNQYSVSAAQPGLSVEIVGNLRIPVPTAAEQTAIATFLDRETAKIDALVAEQEKLITLLQEKRQAVISHAVTKGLNPNVPMKDSGVEWLGEVPSHWDVKKIRFLLKRDGLIRGPFGGDLKKEIFVDSGVKVYEQKNAIYKSAELGSSFISEAKYSDMIRFSVLPGDYIMSCSGTIGKAYRIPEQAPRGIINQALLILRFNNSLAPEFIDWLLIADFFATQIIDNSQGGAMKNLVSMDAFTSISLPVPTQIEQAEISEYLQREVKQIDSLVEEGKRGVELLKERRTALISAAVTGQIDVRGLAGGANAPDSIAASAYPASSIG